MLHYLTKTESTTRALTFPSPYIIISCSKNISNTEYTFNLGQSIDKIIQIQMHMKTFGRRATCKSIYIF